MNENINEIKRKVKKQLDKERYQHTLGVAYTAASMAMRYNSDMENAFTAGLLHDCAKCIPNEEKYSMCEKYSIELDDTEKVCPYLVHAKLGAYIAEHTYGIKSAEITDAIRTHTTGCPDMTLLQKIIFTADYIEPNRSEAPDLQKIRVLAFSDLDAAVTEILKDTLGYLDAKDDRPVDPMTKITYDYYNKRSPDKT